MSEDCIFCKIVAGQIPSTKVYETDAVYAFRDINPAAPTHVLIVPKRHLASIAAMQDDDAPLLGQIMLAARDIAAQEGVADGYRLIANNGASSGQAVFHLHFHLLAGRRF